MGKSFNISGNGSVSAMESEVEKLNKRIDESAGLIQITSRKLKEYLAEI